MPSALLCKIAKMKNAQSNVRNTKIIKLKVYVNDSSYFISILTHAFIFTFIPISKPVIFLISVNKKYVRKHFKYNIFDFQIV